MIWIDEMLEHINPSQRMVVHEIVEYPSGRKYLRRIFDETAAEVARDLKLDSDLYTLHEMELIGDIMEVRCRKFRKNVQEHDNC